MERFLSSALLVLSTSTLLSSGLSRQEGRRSQRCTKRRNTLERSYEVRECVHLATGRHAAKLAQPARRYYSHRSKIAGGATPHAGPRRQAAGEHRAPERRHLLAGVSLTLDVADSVDEAEAERHEHEQAPRKLEGEDGAEGEQDPNCGRDKQRHPEHIRVRRMHKALLFKGICG